MTPIELMGANRISMVARTPRRVAGTFFAPSLCRKARKGRPCVGAFFASQHLMLRRLSLSARIITCHNLAIGAFSSGLFYS